MTYVKKTNENMCQIVVNRLKCPALIGLTGNRTIAQRTFPVSVVNVNNLTHT